MPRMEDSMVLKAKFLVWISTAARQEAVGVLTAR